MLKDSVAVFDIGSSKVTGLIGENGVNNNFIIRAISDVPHDALYDGKIDDANGIEKALRSSFKTIVETAKAKIDCVYVGVPGEFTEIINKQHKVYFNRRRKMRKKDEEEFLSEAGANIGKQGYEVIDRRAVMYYTDGEKRVESLLNEVTASVNGYVTFFLAKESFTTLMRRIFSSLGVKKVKFVPVSLAESLYLFNVQERFAYQILLDVGYITSSIAVIYGGGLLYQGAFPLGGGHITAYLYEKLHADFDLAERIKRRINLTVPKEFEGTYEINWGEEVLSFPQKDCNDVARSVIAGIAEQVDGQLVKSRVKLPHNLAVSLTGGGISHVRGGKEYLSDCIEMPVNVVRPPIAYMSKPEDSSYLSVLNYALNLV